MAEEPREFFLWNMCGEKLPEHSNYGSCAAEKMRFLERVLRMHQRNFNSGAWIAKNMERVRILEYARQSKWNFL